MSKPQLKVWFTDFWGGFDLHANPFLKMLGRDYEVLLDRQPDLLICSCYSFDHLAYKCHKLFYTGENVRPDYKLFDRSLSFDWDDYGGKNLRFPLFRFNGDLEKYHLVPPQPQRDVQDKKFCCMLVSNPNGLERNEFFDLLSQYKTVDSGGAYRNNVGGRVEDKLSFIADYKFVLSFENSMYPGYSSEKVLEPLIAGTVPVYWGNPEIGKDFNEQRIINVHRYSDFRAVVDLLVKLDQDDTLYEQMVRQPVYPEDKFPHHLEWEYLSEKCCTMVSEMLSEPPVAERHPLYALTNKYKRKIKARILGKQHWYC